MAPYQHRQIRPTSAEDTGPDPTLNSRACLIGAMDFAPAQGAPIETSPLAMSEHPGPTKEVFGTSRRNSSIVDGNAGGDLYRTNSTMSQSQTLTPSRGGTLKKKASISKRASLKRSGSKKASGPGSVRLPNAGKETFSGVDGDEINNAFFVPVPTTGNPTEILVDRFQGKHCRCAAVIVWALQRGRHNSSLLERELTTDLM